MQDIEAAPICRGKNLSWETVLLFYNNMPRQAMPKAQFHAYVEQRITGWTQTHSQIARQLAFYYEDGGYCYPRFCDKTSYAELFSYMQNWASKYFVPNPYTPSLKGYSPICIYSYLAECIKNGNKDFDNALDSMFQTKLSSHDKVRVYISNFTDIIIDNEHYMTRNDRTFPVNSLSSKEMPTENSKSYFDYFSTELQIKEEKIIDKNNSRQIIYYGAPGTGKSNKIDELTNYKNRIRTTFHPDSDYSTFMGAYKPIMRPSLLRDISGHRVKDENSGNELWERKIEYKFVPQAFLKAYVEAWKRKTEGNDEPYYLIIEEINRGNCAQIFGDLFQLLDRDDEGKSRYGICPDEDITDFLKDQFAALDIEDEDIKSGKMMRLPSNLYIWATMNTSDQSLFPIDSAFKRRWDWEYMPIADAGKGHVIEIGDKQYDWWNFISIINDKIGKITSSEDKKLGYWFVVPANGGITISSKQFVSKVLFYLWNDVYKDYMESSENIFKTLDDGKVNEAPFTSFFGTDAEERLQGFMAYNGIKPMEGYKEIGNQYEPVVNESEEADSYNSTKDTSEYTVNGKGPFKKTIVAAEVFKAYIENNTNSTAKEIESLWKTFNQSPVLHLFEDEEGYKQYHKDNQRTKKRFECVVFKGTNFYLWKDWGVDNFDYIKSIAQRLGIIITKIPQ